MLNNVDREVIEHLCSKALSNRSEAVTLRRDVLGLKLSQISETVKFVDSQLMQKTDDNNKRLAILQGLVQEGLASNQEQPPVISQCQADLRNSEGELEAVKSMSEEFTNLEHYSCRITLSDSRTGKKYNVKGPLSFGNLSAHGSQVSASVSLLTYALQQMKAANLWEEVDEETPIRRQEHTPVSQQFVPRFDLAQQFKKLSPTGISGLASANSSGYASPATSPIPISSPVPNIPQNIHNLQGNICFLQFSINGEVKPKVFIKLYASVAPIVSSLIYCYKFVTLLN